MLPERLRFARKRMKLTQEQLAEKVKTTKGTISNYENGYSSPSNEMLSDLAKVLGVSTDFLLGNVDYEENKVIVSGKEVALTSEELKIFEEIKKHPILFHNLASNPEGTVKELIKLYKMKKILLEEDDEDYGDGFGDLKD